MMLGIFTIYGAIASLQDTDKNKIKAITEANETEAAKALSFCYTLFTTMSEKPEYLSDLFSENMDSEAIEECRQKLMTLIPSETFLKTVQKFPGNVFKVLGKTNDGRKVALQLDSSSQQFTLLYVEILK